MIIFGALILLLCSSLLSKNVRTFLSVSIVYVFFSIIFPSVFLIYKLLTNNKVWHMCNSFGVKIMNIKTNIRGVKLIDTGIIITNHVSMMDGAIDNVFCESEGIYRTMFYFSVLLNGVIVYLEDWGICINRGKTSRHELIKVIEKKLEKKCRILLYPEGTRCSYYDKEKINNVNLKPGTLVSIYQELPNTAIQLFIGLNKSKVFKSDNGLIDRFFGNGVCIYYNRLEPIYPKNFKTVDDFIHKIEELMVNSYNDLRELSK